MAINIGSPTEMTSYLNEYQKNLASMQDYDPLESGSVDKFMEENLGMVGQAPEAPKYVDMYKEMREEFGVDEMEQSMNWYKDMLRREELLLNQQKNYMREQPVRLGVIEGRVDKATRDRQEQMQWYSNELARVSDRVQSAYGQIQMIMQFSQMDYETAKDVYQTEFNNRMSVYKTLTEEKQWRFETQLKVTQMAQEQFNADRAFASTQWSMMASYISNGQTSWAEMSADQKAQVTKYEAQMGLPIGFMSTLRMEAGANIISTTTRTDPKGNVYADIIYQNPDGSPRVESVLTGKTKVESSGGSASTEVDMSGVYKQVYGGMTAQTGKDGKVSPTTYNANRAYWVSKGGSASDFDKEFGSFINPTHYWNVRDGVWSSTQYNTSIAPER